MVLSYFDALLRYFEFNGRSSRRQYWFYQFFALAVVLGAFWLDWKAGDIDLAHRRLGFISLFAVIVHVIPSITVTVRRLHDSGRSGFWYLLNFVPFGGLVLLAFMFSRPTAEADRYGDDPRLGMPKPSKKAAQPTRSQEIVAQLEARRNAVRAGLGVSA